MNILFPRTRKQISDEKRFSETYGTVTAPDLEYKSGKSDSKSL
jgi:hypothetical protein